MMHILKCEAFDGEPSGTKVNRCCVGDCHARDSLIPVTPYALDATPENRRLDWEMGIQAMVCCGRFEFVRSLSREWWVNKGEQLKLWDYAKCLQLMHKGSWHSSFDAPRSGNVSSSSGRGISGPTKKVSSGQGKCPACGVKWNGDVCENCGHGGGI